MYCSQYDFPTFEEDCILDDKEKLRTPRPMQSAMNKFLAGSGGNHPVLQSHFGHGDPDAVMKSFVESEAPDLIVVGTHGRTGLRRALIGSVAARILETVPSDVMAIHPNA